MQQISVVTVAVGQLARSRQFYTQGFGWRPVFENDEIVFYQMNGFVFGTWLESPFRQDSQLPHLGRPGGFSLAHNVPTRADVDSLMKRLASHGGRTLRPPGAPSHGGWRGYIADPDDHTWEIAWNPAWKIDDRGLVEFGT